MSGGALTHPSPDQLAAFGAGRLGDSESASVEQHLAMCEPCCYRMKVLPSDDSYVALIREAGSSFGSTVFGAAHPTSPVQVASASTPRVTEPDTHAAETVLFVSTETPAADPELPKELTCHPRYRILRRLGGGGMGAVYEAEHRLMNRRVALKVIRPELLSSPQAVMRFQREVQAAAKLVHPHVVTAFDAEQAGHSHFLVMEFVDGSDLAEVVRRRGPLPVVEACECIRQAAIGLQHAFEHGMVHRDIKPGNLMVAEGRGLRGEWRDQNPSVLSSPLAPHPSPHIKILDFGLARFASESVEHLAGGNTSVGVVLGTPDYMAPEQARNAHAADIRSDIYSLGCSLHFLLTGQVLHPGSGSVIEKALAHIEQSVEPLAKFRCDIPPGLQTVLDRMTAKKSAERYATPAEVASALAPFGATAGLMNRSDVSDAHRPLTAGIKRVLAATGLVGFVLVMAVIVHVVTDKGDLRIESQVADVRVLLHQNGTPFRLLDIPTGTTVARLPSGEYTFELKGDRSDVRFNPNKVRLTRSSKVPLEITKIEPPLEPPEPTEPQLLRKLEGHREWVMSVTFSQNGNELASASKDSTVRFWNPESGEPIGEAVQSRDHMRAVVYSPDGRWIATAGHDFTIQLLDAATKISQATLRGHENFVTSLAWSGDSQLLVSGSDDGTVRRWDIATRQQLPEIGRHESAVSAVAFSAEKNIIASGGKDHGVRLWDAQSLQSLATLPGHVDEIRSLTFDRNGQWLASGSKDGTVRLWDVEKRQFEALLAPQEGRVYAVAFAPDGRHLAVGCGDWGYGVVKLWDVETRQLWTTLSGPTAFVHSVAFSPDGSRLAAGGGDWGIRIWKLPRDRAVP